MRVMAAIVSMLLGVALTLAAVGVLLLATRSVEQMTHPLLRALAIAAAVCLGVVLLVGSVWVATRLAVLASGRPRDSQ